MNPRSMSDKEFRREAKEFCKGLLHGRLPTDMCSPPGYCDFLGVVHPDPASIILDTGYWRFSSPIGIDGLAKWQLGRLDILALKARNPSTGALREFISQSKTHYDQVFVWILLNPALEQALARYGFVPTVEIQTDGEVLTGMSWRTQ